MQFASAFSIARLKVPVEIHQLIRAMSLANPLWSAPRIRGELLKLSIDVGQISVAKYMSRHRTPSSQGWMTFLRNHADPSPLRWHSVADRGTAAAVRSAPA